MVRARNERYVMSPLVVVEEAVDTANALRGIDCTRETIIRELRAKYGFTRETSARILREAARRRAPSLQ